MGISLHKMIVREMARSKINTLMCLLVVGVSVGVLTAMAVLSKASVDATRKMMKDMGFNLLITPPGVSPARYQALDFGGGDLPEDYVARLMNEGRIMAQHFVGKYQKVIAVQGCTIVLTGILAEQTRVGTEKLPMPTAYAVAPGEVFVGSAVGAALDLAVGQRIEILGKPFTVARVLEESGVSPDDIRIFAHLHDVQSLLNVPGRVNAIDALACQCPASVGDILLALEQSIHAVLPEVQVHPYKSILLARHGQRVMMARIGLAALIAMIAGSAAALCGLTYQNVRARRREIGVLRALGISGGRIGVLFIGKILVYSVLGAILGGAGGVLAAHGLHRVYSEAPLPIVTILGFLAGAPVAAVLFGLPPIAAGLLQEAVDVLGEQET